MSNTIFKPENNPSKSFIPLTKFENDVLRLLCNKKNPQEVSEELGVNIHTIYAYKASLFQKFQTKNLQYLKKLCKS